MHKFHNTHLCLIVSHVFESCFITQSLLHVLCFVLFYPFSIKEFPFFFPRPSTPMWDILEHKYQDNWITNRMNIELKRRQRKKLVYFIVNSWLVFSKLFLFKWMKFLPYSLSFYKLGIKLNSLECCIVWKFYSDHLDGFWTPDLTHLKLPFRTQYNNYPVLWYIEICWCTSVYDCIKANDIETIIDIKLVIIV